MVRMPPRGRIAEGGLKIEGELLPPQRATAAHLRSRRLPCSPSWEDWFPGFAGFAVLSEPCEPGQSYTTLGSQGADGGRNSQPSGDFKNG